MVTMGTAATLCGLLMCVLIGPGHCSIRNGGDLYDMASNLGVSYEVITHFTKGFDLQIKLTNGANFALEFGDWAIYFTHIFWLEESKLKKPGKGNTSTPVGGEWILTHHQGSLFSLRPMSNFTKWSPRGEKKIKLKGNPWSVSRTDSMPHWYMVAKGVSEPQVITATNDIDTLSFVAARTKPEQYKRDKNDRYDPLTPQERFEHYSTTDKGSDSCSRIIPKPYETKVKSKNSVCITSRWSIVCTGDFVEEGNFLKDSLWAKHQDLNLNLVSNPKNKVIRLVKERVGSSKVLKGDEAYSLDISTSEITITANNPKGAFYGIISLFSLMKNKCVQEVTIRDGPRFGYRGLMLDIARNFHTHNEVIKIIGAMARYKLNILHLHLSDDEAWRIQIEGLPELTTIGSKVCHDPEERECLMPQLGAKPSKSGKFWTGDNYKEVLKAAMKHKIQVIPEIDMPGHARAAVISMKERMRNRYHGMKDVSLQEPGDQSAYSTVQMFSDNAINVCLESVYTFVETVVDSFVKYHKNIQPLKFFHVGLDEVGRGAWTNSTACKNLKTKSKDTPKLYFLKRVGEILHKKGIELGAWEDGMMETGQKPFDKSEVKSQVTAYAWDSVWEWGVAPRTYNFANKGYKVVLAHATHLYGDHPYERDPEERGFYWATSRIDTLKSFLYDAVGYYNNLHTQRFGDPIDDTTRCKQANSCPKLTKTENIIGMQASMWSETIRTEENMHSMLFPRLLAVAERAWHQAEWEGRSEREMRDERNADWSGFVHAVGCRELEWLDDNGFKFRVPPPGVKIENGKLKASGLYEGVDVEYSTNKRSWQKIRPHGTQRPSSCPFYLRSKYAGRISRVVDFRDC